MASSTSQGNYCKNKSRTYFESLGYIVQLTEVSYTVPIGGGKVIWKKKDIFGTDGIAMNGKETIFWNSKRAEKEEYVSSRKSECKKEFEKYPFSPDVKVCAIIWVPRKKQPYIFYF